MPHYYNDNDPQKVTWLRYLTSTGRLEEGTIDERSIKAIPPEALQGYTRSSRR